MAITISALGARATVEGGEWSSDNPVLLYAATEISRTYYMIPIRPLYHPYPDLSLAEYVAKALGGEVVEKDEPVVEPGAIY